LRARNERQRPIFQDASSRVLLGLLHASRVARCTRAGTVAASGAGSEAAAARTARRGCEAWAHGAPRSSCTRAAMAHQWSLKLLISSMGPLLKRMGCAASEWKGRAWKSILQAQGTRGQQARLSGIQAGRGAPGPEPSGGVLASVRAPPQSDASRRQNWTPRTAALATTARSTPLCGGSGVRAGRWAEWGAAQPPRRRKRRAPPVRCRQLASWQQGQQQPGGAARAAARRSVRLTAAGPPTHGSRRRTHAPRRTRRLSTYFGIWRWRFGKRREQARDAPRTCS